MNPTGQTHFVNIDDYDLNDNAAKQFHAFLVQMTVQVLKQFVHLLWMECSEG